MAWDTHEASKAIALAPGGERENPSGLVALIGDAPHAWTMVNALRARFGDFPVIIERGESAAAFWARRKKLLGARTVLSMKLAQLAMKAASLASRRRLRELEAECATGPAPAHLCRNVASLNAPDAIALVESLAPRAVFVASTGMLRKDLLGKLACPVVNYHSGVNPAYRGIHGGYFALANGEPENFGVTLHLVDRGVDTGAILATNRIETSRRDTIGTYMMLMAARSQELVTETMARVIAGEVQMQASTLPSRQHFAPTLGAYLRNGLLRGVW